MCTAPFDATLVRYILLCFWASRSPPRHAVERVAAALQERRARYGVADYWVAYDVAWLTHERVLLTPRPRINVRMRRYREAVLQHWSEAVEVTTTACTGGYAAGPYFVCTPTETLEPVQRPRR